MTEWIAVSIATFALIISGVTAWLTYGRRGNIRMTQPTVVYFGPDGSIEQGRGPRPKVFLRTLLYSTSKRGQVVESMHVNIARGETSQNFSIWVYGDKALLRGSGLFIGAEGIATNHHFLLLDDGVDFRWLAGHYTLSVYAKRVIDSTARLLCQIKLEVSESNENKLKQENAGLYFNWGPDQQVYHPHIDIREPKPIPPWLLDAANQ